MANNQKEASSFGLLTMAALCAFGTFTVPNEAAQYFLGTSSLLSLVLGWDRFERERDIRRKRKLAEMPTGVHGTASFMTGRHG